MIPVNSIITKLNSYIAAGGLSNLELAQVFGAIESLEKTGIGAVPTTSDLPPATDNKGRFIYITAEDRYVFSNGSNWNINNIIRFADSNLYDWGSGSNGRLGDGVVVARSSPVSVIGGFTDWAQVSVGDSHTLGVRANGTAWAWGDGTLGRLGDNTAVTKSSPVSVVGGFTDWAQISAGYSHSLGVRANGTAWGWGSGSFGRLGDNTAVARSSPVSVVGGFTDWVQLSAGNAHSLGVRANGTAWAWGVNTNGRLGDNVGATLSRSSPVLVVGGFTDWIQLSAGASHSLGLRANGTAWAWGINTNGRLGDNVGATLSRSSPVSVVGGFTDWVQVSAGASHSTGVRANGSLWSWGLGTNGRLGDNTATLSRSSPVSVAGGFTDWVQVSALAANSLGLRADGTAWAWGFNSVGQLGDETTVTRSSPVSVVGNLKWVLIGQGSNSTHGAGITD